MASGEAELREGIPEYGSSAAEVMACNGEVLGFRGVQGPEFKGQHILKHFKTGRNY